MQASYQRYQSNRKDTSQGLSSYRYDISPNKEPHSRNRSRWENSTPKRTVLGNKQNKYPESNLTLAYQQQMGLSPLKKSLMQYDIHSQKLSRSRKIYDSHRYPIDIETNQYLQASRKHPASQMKKPEAFTYDYGENDIDFAQQNKVKRQLFQKKSINNSSYKISPIATPRKSNNQDSENLFDKSERIRHKIAKLNRMTPVKSIFQDEAKIEEDVYSTNYMQKEKSMNDYPSETQKQPKNRDKQDSYQKGLQDIEFLSQKINDRLKSIIKRHGD